MKFGKTFAAAIRPVKRLNVWQWAERNVDFSRAPAYETPLRGPYDPELMPYWREIAEAMTDPSVRECWVVKAARAGGSENLLLNPLRYTVACDPKSTLYMGADQALAEDFMESRIKLGLRCAAATARKLAGARVGEHRIYFPEMDLILRWPRAKGAFKQRGFGLILADEISIWPEFVIDLLRKRAETYAFAHIIGISSMDPAQKRSSKHDPIWQCWEMGDQREWMMPDPKTRKLFRFEMGTEKSVYGLKWDTDAKKSDGSWDLDRVRASAHYMTPDGTRIENARRLNIVSRGRWVPTNQDAPRGVRSYRLGAFCLPWRQVDFGNLAVEFLRAKRGGPEMMRAFRYEYEADEWRENVLPTASDSISRKTGHYQRGGYLSEMEPHKTVYAGKTKKVFVTVDVQQSVFWWLAREWIAPGDSGLIDLGYCVTWAEVDTIARRVKAFKTGVDCGYSARRGEVETYCSDFDDVMLQGRDDFRGGTKFVRLPKYPGTARQTNALTAPLWLIQFSADAIKTRLWQMVEGYTEAKWFVHDFLGHEYLWQMASEECVDGHWEKKKSTSQNHLWDCEVMQVVLARSFGLLEDFTLPVEDL